jgi:hypothetical protein
MEDKAHFPMGRTTEDDGLRQSFRALFDSAYYVSQYPDVEDLGIDPFEHFVSKGRFESRSPHPLFDTRYYLRKLPASSGVEDPVAHYLQIGHSQGLTPHPLFDPDHYAKQIAGELGSPALLHYLTEGWRLGLSPHALFDPQYYVASGGIELGGSDPLSHYLVQEEFNFAPHYLFSDAVYVAELHKVIGDRAPDAYRDGPPLLHYVLAGHIHEPKTHPLFDPAFYRSELLRTLAASPDESIEAGIAAARDMLRHYLDIGVPLGVSPSGFFDLPFYLQQVGEAVAGDPLRHYLTPDGYRRFSPHPGIDLDYYSRHAGFLPTAAGPADLAPSGLRFGPLQAHLRRHRQGRCLPGPALSRAWHA